MVDTSVINNTIGELLSVEVKNQSVSTDLMKQIAPICDLLESEDLPDDCTASELILIKYDKIMFDVFAGRGWKVKSLGADVNANRVNIEKIPGGKNVANRVRDIKAALLIGLDLREFDTYAAMVKAMKKANSDGKIKNMLLSMMNKFMQDMPNRIDMIDFLHEHGLDLSAEEFTHLVDIDYLVPEVELLAVV